MKRQRVPADSPFHAAGKALDEVPGPGRHIDIVEDVRAVLLDLRPQDIGQGRPRGQAMLARPNTLNLGVVAVSKKGPFRLLIDRQKGMTPGFAKTDECIHLGGEGRKIGGQFAHFRPQRRIVS
jgi:hypothetical protein